MTAGIYAAARTLPLPECCAGTLDSVTVGARRVIPLSALETYSWASRAPAPSVGLVPTNRPALLATAGAATDQPSEKGLTCID